MKIHDALTQKRCVNDLSSCCIGDSCMAWRYNKKIPDGYKQPTHNGIVPPPPVPYVIDTENGFCGLAGKETEV